MSAIELLQAAQQATWLVIAVSAALRAVRRPTRASVDTAILFAAIALVVVESRIAPALGPAIQREASLATTVLVVAVPYLLLRVIRDFTHVRAWVMRSAEVALLAAIAVVAWPRTGALPIAALLLVVAYWAVVAIYAAARAVRLASASFGVTRYRMRAVALGSYLLGLVILVAAVGSVAPAVVGVTSALTQVLAVGCALAYFVGFTPPDALRRSWQSPELRAFLLRASTLPRSTMDAIVREIEGVAGRTLGARATIGLWDDRAGVLRFRDQHGALPRELGMSSDLAWRVFASQVPLYAPDALAVDPDGAERYRSANVRTVLIAPITAGGTRLGILEVFAPRESIFAEEDLAFVELVAQQAAILIQSRQLIDDAARVQAEAESVRLKEDFVSAAAHDLKTPLTTILGQAQLLEHRAVREGRQAELDGLRRLEREATQLSRLVEELLDASRLERGAFPVHIEDGDLSAVAREVAGRQRTGFERVAVDAPEPVPGRFDHDRVRQLVDNLIENALKYSPDGGRVEVRVRSVNGVARLSVSDHGIGIPPDDLPHLFERFRRGSNVDHRRFGGIGLGLYICKGIVEQHGGRMWVESAQDVGTTFHVELPGDGAAAGAPARAVAR